MIPAVYDAMAAAVRGRPVPTATAARAAAASGAEWERAIRIEGCGPWLEWARRRDDSVARAVEPVRAQLKTQGEAAVAHALAALAQLHEIAAVAHRPGWRFLVLKGAARLLAGEPAGRRTLSDIDLLVEARAADALHAALRHDLGYRPDEPGTPDRHLPALGRDGGLNVELHTRLADRASPLDIAIWQGTRVVALGEVPVEIPSPTALARHTLQHSLVVHRTLRYRLRDVLDAAAVCGAAGADPGTLRAVVRGSAMRTLLAAAGVTGDEDRAWRTVRRVAVARLRVPARDGVDGDRDPLVYLISQLAEGSPAVLAGLAWRAVREPWRTAHTIHGALWRAVGR